MPTKLISGRCVICGDDDPRSLKEYHHIYGRSNSSETIILCLACHSKITHDQNQFPPKARSKKASEEDKRDFEDVSIGSLLELLGKRLKKKRVEQAWKSHLGLSM